MELIQSTDECGEYLVEIRCNQKDKALLEKVISFVHIRRAYIKTKEELMDDLGLEL